MLLTITNRQSPATDLGYLLRKHPGKCQAFELNYGRAHVFYPQAAEDVCTAALLLEIDPVGLVRNRRGPSGEGRTLDQYVNDRPYVASSFLSVAIGEVFGSAMAGKAVEKSELVDTPLPLEATLSSVPSRGGAELLKRLFEPLGYEVAATGRPLDERFPDWGESPYFDLKLKGRVTLRRLLTHLYVLIPVLDNDKHYWVGDDEVEKLLRHGAGWLEEHPERELIARRYLKHRRDLFEDVLARLTDETDSDEAKSARADDEAAVEAKMSLNEQRLGTALAALKRTGAASVIDLGCGEGRLLSVLLKDQQFEKITGMDVSYRSLEIAKERLNFERLPTAQRQRINLIHGSLIYRDARLEGYDAASVIEVIEHLDPPRLSAFERVLFECAQPRHVVVTTPNAEYNVKWESLPAGKFRHRDHRFEWTRAQFQDWANGVASCFDYKVQFAPVGPEDSVVGSPTQMAVFAK